MSGSSIVRCRCCLSPKTAVHYSLMSIITDLPGTTAKTILKVLQKVTGIRVVVSDCLPKEICQQCLLDLKVSYKFITSFKKSQKLLPTVQEETYDVIKTEEFDYYFPLGLIGDNIKEEQQELLTKHLYSLTVPEPTLSDHDYHSKMQIEDPLEKKNIIDCHSEIHTEERPPKNENIIIMTVEDVMKADEQQKRNPKSKETAGKEMRSGAYKCEDCGLIYDNLRNLKRHKYALHNPNWEEMFKCSICGVSYDTRPKLRHHKERDHLDERFICYLCGKVYRIKQHLRVHIQSRHDSHNQYRHLCPQCGRSFRSTPSLQYHLKRHENRKSFMCRFCGFRSMSLCGLKRHERTHTGEKPFKCRFCPKFFAGVGDLSKHEAVHTGKKPYSCQYCPKTFTQNYNKKVHLMQHPGEYSCEMCNRTFIDEAVLKFHYRYKHRIVLDCKDDDEMVNDEN